MGSCLTFLYDGQTGRVMGRGCRSWVQITLFYMFYYSCIACFFSATVGTYYHLMDAHKPHVTGEDNLLMNQPGLGFEPMIDEGAESNFVYVNTGDAEYTMKYVQRLKEVLKKYNQTHQASHGLLHTGTCSPASTARRDGAQVACQVEEATLTQACSEATDYGYTGDPPGPCVLIRLNKIYGFKPSLVKCSDDRAKDMEPGTCVNGQVHLHCSGALAGDYDNINSIRYFPNAGFPVRYYPYLKQPGYLAPLVFIKLNITRYVPVSIVCHAIAQNIDVKLTHQEKYIGSVRVDVLVD